MCKIYDNYLKYQDEIKNAESCGLTHTGEYEDGRPQFLGNNLSWSKFNDGDFTN